MTRIFSFDSRRCIFQPLSCSLQKKDIYWNENKKKNCIDRESNPGRPRGRRAFFFLSLLQFTHHVITYHSHILHFSYIYISSQNTSYFSLMFFLRIYVKSKIENLYHTHFIHHFIWIWIMSIVYFPFFIVPKIK